MPRSAPPPAAWRKARNRWSDRAQPSAPAPPRRYELQQNLATPVPRGPSESLTRPEIAFGRRYKTFLKKPESPLPKTSNPELPVPEFKMPEVVTPAMKMPAFWTAAL
ncbi:hypothetical protein LAUMK191_03572 [Mycobacterium attenuatum]|uniref:Uncharacterized protein n=1 Tax=Mycobacterium attenuatum TaxID=2341086 RepID=A0A498Q4A6_9MYCO|nr:hypothetical protein LAUMK136_03600 [Mycobacterium attenuatum]VBA56218.1 hypothetical protein LAUMK191_03572 [Mycobacterium attenuatum]VBA59831.1 hypothetical protein LAUMK41_03691 [Mycobacterium attenuatum]